MNGLVDLNTFSGLTEAVKNHGSLSSTVRFYDTKSGDIYRAVAVYPSGPPHLGVCIDIEVIPLGEPD